MCVVQCWVVAAAVRVGIVLVSDSKYWGSSYLTLHPKPTTTATKNHNICSYLGGIMLKAFIVVATRTNHLNWKPNHIALLKGASGGRRYTSSNCQTACYCIKCTTRSEPWRILQNLAICLRVCNCMVIRAKILPGSVMSIEDWITLQRCEWQLSWVSSGTVQV